MIHKLWRSIVKLLKKFGVNCLFTESLSKIADPDFDVDKNLKSFDNMYFGPKCEETLKKLSAEDAKTVRENCGNFYITAIKEIRERLFEHREFLSLLHFIDPDVVLDLNAREKLPDLHEFCKYFPFLDKQSLAIEWRNLPIIFEEKKESLIKLNEEKFWF